MSDFEWAKPYCPIATGWNCSDVERQAHELRERLKRERETEPSMTWEEWSELHPPHLPDHDTLIIIDELRKA